MNFSEKNVLKHYIFQKCQMQVSLSAAQDLPHLWTGSIKMVEKWKATSDGKYATLKLGNFDNIKGTYKINTGRQSRNDTAVLVKNSSSVRSDGRFWWRGDGGLLRIIGRLRSITGGSHVTRRISRLGISVAVRHGLLDDGLQMFSFRFVAIDDGRDVTTVRRWTRNGSGKRMSTAANFLHGSGSWAVTRRSILQCWDMNGLQHTPTN